jgi:glucose-1-phosphate cytidylyltransferase
MKIYGYYGFKDFVLCLGYRGNMIKEFFLNYEPMNSDFTISLGTPHRLYYHGAHDEQDFRVTLSDTGLDSMTGSRIARVRRYVEDDETFMVTYGDGLSDVNVARLLEFHRSHGRIATVTTVRPTSRFGVLDVDGAGRVLSFAEKPRLDGRVSAGFFVFNRTVFSYLSDDPACVLEREPMERLVKDGQLVAYQHDGFFHAMDTFREFKYLNELWDTSEAPWKVW